MRTPKWRERSWVGFMRKVEGEKKVTDCLPPAANWKKKLTLDQTLLGSKRCFTAILEGHARVLGQFSVWKAWLQYMIKKLVKNEGCRWKYIGSIQYLLVGVAWRQLRSVSVIQKFCPNLHSTLSNQWQGGEHRQGCIMYILIIWPWEGEVRECPEWRWLQNWAQQCQRRGIGDFCFPTGPGRIYGDSGRP